jgi:hypothetical protein
VLRVLFNLFDGFTIRHLTQRIIMTVMGLGVGLIGVGFLLAAAYEAVADELGSLDASLIFAAVFIILGIALFGLASYQWNRRPRPMLARARLGVVAEALAIAQTLIRKDPAKAVFAALVLGAITEYTRKRDSERAD